LNPKIKMIGRQKAFNEKVIRKSNLKKHHHAPTRKKESEIGGEITGERESDEGSFK
jgi:hypothetical protein